MVMGRWTTLPLCLALTACGGTAPAPAAKPVAATPSPGEPEQRVDPTPSASPDPFADQPRVLALTSEWWASAASCPDGGGLVGAAPPAGRSVHCEKDGERHGPGIRWGSQHIQVSSYSRGEYDGPYGVWNLDEVKIEEGLWRAGKQEGVFMQWHANGAKKTLGHFADDRRTGEWIEWAEDGSVVARAHYRDGVAVDAPGSEDE